MSDNDKPPFVHGAFRPLLSPARERLANLKPLDIEKDPPRPITKEYDPQADPSARPVCPCGVSGCKGCDEETPDVDPNEHADRALYRNEPRCPVCQNTGKPQVAQGANLPCPGCGRIAFTTQLAGSPQAFVPATVLVTQVTEEDLSDLSPKLAEAKQLLDKWIAGEKSELQRLREENARLTKEVATKEGARLSLERELSDTQAAYLEMALGWRAKLELAVRAIEMLSLSKKGRALITPRATQPINEVLAQLPKKPEGR